MVVEPLCARQESHDSRPGNRTPRVIAAPRGTGSSSKGRGVRVSVSCADAVARKQTMSSTTVRRAIILTSITTTRFILAVRSPELKTLSGEVILQSRHEPICCEDRPHHDELSMRALHRALPSSLPDSVIISQLLPSCFADARPGLLPAVVGALAQQNAAVRHRAYAALPLDTGRPRVVVLGTGTYGSVLRLIHCVGSRSLCVMSESGAYKTLLC